MADLRHTPLHDLHVAQGAKMVPFAGWDMPVQYPLGVLSEHLHTRAHAGLFDVSHMGQIIIRPKSGTVEQAAKSLERLVPANIIGLAEGRQRYGLLTSESGGILDDVMIANRGDHLFVVVNAGCVEQDLALLAQLDDVTIEHVTDRALLALQGPSAENVLVKLVPSVAGMVFMDVAIASWDGTEIWLSRSGYTGEDGFEISVPADRADDFAGLLQNDAEVALIGLGARDSLRLEAGMPLYGHDMTTGISPAAAGVGWSIPAVRRKGGAREGGFPGAATILAEIAEGASRVRTGLRPEGRAPLREGVEIFASQTGGDSLGVVSSGGFGPTVGGPVAMAILPADLSPGTRVWAELRGKRVAATVTALPFVKSDYKR